ncbi:MAG: ABC transporter permease [bacterium]|nr:ABC transporter permease [bacterium]
MSKTYTIIGQKGAQDSILKEMIAYRELVFYFAWREFKVRYKQTVIGIFWVVLQPVLFTLVITLLLFRGIKAPFGDTSVPAVIAVYAGLMIWNYFEQSLNNASNSLVNNQSIITKVYFPRYIPALSAVAIGVLDYFIAFLFFIIFAFLLGVGVNILVTVGSGILAAMIVAITTYGLGVFFATLNIQFRDIKFALPFMLRILLFASPVFYPLTFLPSQYHWVLFLNPITLAIEQFRYFVLGLPSNLTPLHISLSLTMMVAMLIIGHLYFRKKERIFADIA